MKSLVSQGGERWLILCCKGEATRLFIRQSVHALSAEEFVAGRRDHVGPGESGDAERRFAGQQCHVWRARVSVQCGSKRQSKLSVCKRGED